MTTTFPIGTVVNWTTPDGKSKRRGTVEEVQPNGNYVVQLNIVLSVIARPAEVEAVEAFEVVS